MQVNNNILYLPCSYNGFNILSTNNFICEYENLEVINYNPNINLNRLISIYNLQNN